MAYEWPDTPASGRSSAGISNITAANFLVNDFLQIGRTIFGTVRVSGRAGGGRAAEERGKRPKKHFLAKRGVSGYDVRGRVLSCVARARKVHFFVVSRSGTTVFFLQLQIVLPVSLWWSAVGVEEGSYVCRE